MKHHNDAFKYSIEIKTTDSDFIYLTNNNLSYHKSCGKSENISNKINSKYKRNLFYNLNKHILSIKKG